MSLELIKTSVEQIGKNFEEYKATADKARHEKDSLLESKMAKLADDISAKHEELQKQFNEAQAKAQRPVQTDEQISKAEKDAKTFARARRDVQGSIRVAAELYVPNQEQTQKY